MGILEFLKNKSEQTPVSLTISAIKLADTAAVFQKCLT